MLRPYHTGQPATSSSHWSIMFCGMKLVLFDIDGTLLWTDGAGRRAIQRALVDEAGTAGPIATYRFDGKTDPQIVRDLLSLAGHSGAENPTVIQAVCRRYVEHLRTELERPTQATRLMVGSPTCSRRSSRTRPRAARSSACSRATSRREPP